MFKKFFKLFKLSVSKKQFKTVVASKDNSPAIKTVLKLFLLLAANVLFQSSVYTYEAMRSMQPVFEKIFIINIGLCIFLVAFLYFCHWRRLRRENNNILIFRRPKWEYAKFLYCVVSMVLLISILDTSPGISPWLEQSVEESMPYKIIWLSFIVNESFLALNEVTESISIQTLSYLLFLSYLIIRPIFAYVEGRNIFNFIGLILTISFNFLFTGARQSTYFSNLMRKNPQESGRPSHETGNPAQDIEKTPQEAGKPAPEFLFQAGNYETNQKFLFPSKDMDSQSAIKSPNLSRVEPQMGRNETYTLKDMFKVLIDTLDCGGAVFDLEGETIACNSIMKDIVLNRLNGAEEQIYDSIIRLRNKKFKKNEKTSEAFQNSDDKFTVYKSSLDEEFERLIKSKINSDCIDGPMQGFDSDKEESYDRVDDSFTEKIKEFALIRNITMKFNQKTLMNANDVEGILENLKMEFCVNFTETEKISEKTEKEKVNEVSHFHPGKSMKKQKSTQHFPKLIRLVTHSMYAEADEELVNSNEQHNENEEPLFQVSIVLLKNFLDSDFYVLILVRDLTLDPLKLMVKEFELFKIRMLSSISHEMKTPLNCSLNMMDILNEHLDDPKLKIEYLLPARNCSKILLSKIDDVLDYANITANEFKMNMELFDIRELLIETFNMIAYEAKIRKNVIKFEFDDVINPKIKSDSMRTRQIVLNLLSNANKYTESGMITLRCERVSLKKLRVSVLDTGIGIKRNKIGTLGHVSTNRPTSKKEKLLGMGLSVSNLISSFISPHDQVGIFVSSHKGTGSIFSFYLLDYNNLDEATFAGSHSEDSGNNMDPEDHDSNPEITFKDKREEYNYSESTDNFNIDVSDIMPNLNAYLFIEDLRRKGTDSRAKSQSRSFQTEKGNSVIIERDFSKKKKNFTQYTKSRRQSRGKKKFTVLTNINPNDTLFFENTNFGSSDQISISSNSTISKEVRNNLRPFLVGSKENFNVVNSQTSIQVKSFPNFGHGMSEDMTTSRQEKSKMEILMGYLQTKPCDCPDVLIVDDNGYNITVLKHMVEKLKLKAQSANSGDIAISMVKKFYEQTKCSLKECCAFKLILMDIDMPEKDGFQTSLEIAAYFDGVSNSDKRSVIVACSAFGTAEFIDKSKLYRMKDYITKPVNMEQLKNVMVEYVLPFYFREQAKK